ncbi:MAG TPA: glycoside hydrolase family 27 protein, partial [Mycobacteriales bacterium]|nr:glycoside hydrolase family 27 protein [Mycobacteriales bacterium]
MAASRRCIGRTGLAGRAVLVMALLVASFLSVTVSRAPSAGAAINGLAQHPYLGWSSWSLESTNYPGVNPTGSASWLTEAHVLQQADVMAAKLKSHGYEYINIDAGWQDGVDAYGRPKPKLSTFPDGIPYVANYVHKKGLKLGIYTVVGLGMDAYNGGKTKIYGTKDCHTSDIVYPDLRLTNGWNGAYKINYASPCAQAYANSIADLFAGWGVDFVKMDGVGPGSFQGGANYDNTADVAAWGRALKQTGRPIQYTISWALSHQQADTWKKYTNGWRIDTDVECYCDTLVTWDASVKQRWNDVVQWIPDAGHGSWNNLDSLDVGNGKMDGLTEAERQSYMTLWAIEKAPLFSGDDLTTLDSYGMSLLTNDEVLALDQSGPPAKPVSQRSNQQVWSARNADGSYTVALFNMDSTAATVTAEWGDLGISGAADIRDLWSLRNLGKATDAFGASLPAHGSRLLRITPHQGSGPTLPTGLHGTASTA